MELEKLNNWELLYLIKRAAFCSVYWSRKAALYHLVEVYDYAPMIDDDLFCRLFNKGAIVGVHIMEEALERKIAVEELKVCPLSVDYLIFGEPIVTGSEAERATLLAFYDMVVDKIQKNERRAINWEIKRLSKL